MPMQHLKLRKQVSVRYFSYLFPPSKCIKIKFCILYRLVVRRTLDNRFLCFEIVAYSHQMLFSYRLVSKQNYFLLIDFFVNYYIKTTCLRQIEYHTVFQYCMFFNFRIDFVIGILMIIHFPTYRHILYRDHWEANDVLPYIHSGN